MIMNSKSRVYLLTIPDNKEGRVVSKFIDDQFGTDRLRRAGLSQVLIGLLAKAIRKQAKKNEPLALPKEDKKTSIEHQERTVLSTNKPQEDLKKPSEPQDYLHEPTQENAYEVTKKQHDSQAIPLNNSQAVATQSQMIAKACELLDDDNLQQKFLNSIGL